MKKVFALMLVCLLVLSMTVAVSADPGAFVQSPSYNGDTTLVNADNATEACEAQLAVYSYADRDQMSDESRTAVEAAYASIAGCEDLAALNSGVSTLAEELQIASDKLAVSDLFAIEMSDCDLHDGHGAFTVTVKPHVLDNYACLLQFNGSSWEMVKESSVNEEGTELTFVVDEMNPLAIVVHDGSAVIPEPDEDGNIVLILAIVGAAVAVGVIIFIVIFFKKKKKDEEKTAAGEAEGEDAEL